MNLIISEQVNVPELEDALYQATQLPTFCHPDQDQSGSLVTVVMPMDSEAALFRFGNEAARMMGTRILFRTVLYHFAMQRFSQVSVPGLEFRSTSIVNLKTPNRTEARGLGAIFSYDIDFVGIFPRRSKASVAALASATEDIRTAFNSVSRRLKIGRLRVASATSRAVVGELEWITLPVRSR